MCFPCFQNFGKRTTRVWYVWAMGRSPGAQRHRGWTLSCCAAAFLLQCVRRGLRPHWDAMTPISRDLALKLGFVRPLPYPVVCREEKTGPARSL